jgi:hypothetical protein
MKRTKKFAVVNLIAVLVGAGVPAVAEQNGYGDHNRGGVQSQAANRQDTRGRDTRRDDRQQANRQWSDNRDRGDRHDDRDRDRGFRDDRSYRDNRSYGYGYQPEPVYSAPVYGNGYYQDDHSHDGRTAAIIGSSALAGAVIGGAAGHGQGAVIGAVIGGIAGAAASSAVNHHDRY